MNTTHFTDFMPAACAGFGLLLVGAVNLVLAGRRVEVRVVASIAVLALAMAAAGSLDHPGVVTGTARLLAVGLIPYLLISSRRAVAGVVIILTSLPTPAIRFGLLAATGVGVVVVSVVRFEARSAETELSTLDALAADLGRVPSVPTDRASAVTDRGTRVTLKEPTSARDDAKLAAAEARLLADLRTHTRAIRRGPADDASNCHGWVFTGGRFILGPAEVELVLRENGYVPVAAPRPDDVVVYRTDGVITHTAVVRYVAPGQPVLVEGKWGHLGVFLHPADQSSYGTDHTFYRSSRAGHLLAGLGD